MNGLMGTITLWDSQVLLFWYLQDPVKCAWVVFKVQDPDLLLHVVERRSFSLGGREKRECQVCLLFVETINNCT